MSGWLGAGLGAAAVSAAAAVSLATGSSGLRVTATSVLDDQHDDQDDETDAKIDHGACRFRQDAPQSFKMTGTGLPDCWQGESVPSDVRVGVTFLLMEGPDPVGEAEITSVLTPL